MEIQRDTKGQPFIEWAQSSNGFKRAWIQRKSNPGKDWANAKDGRYLNVVRIENLGGVQRVMQLTFQYSLIYLMSKYLWLLLHQFQLLQVANLSANKSYNKLLKYTPDL